MRGVYSIFVYAIPWENSPHFVTPSLVSTQNDVWATTEGIPYCWRVTYQIWALLTGWSKFSTWHNQSEAVIFHMAQPIRSSDTSSVWNFWSSFLGRYLVGKPVVTLQKGSCFLRLFFFSCRHRHCLFWAYSHSCEVSQGFSISNRVFGNLRFK